MRARLAYLADRCLDKLFDWLEPLAGTCPVCAFLRGMATTLILYLLCYALGCLLALIGG